MPFFGDLAGKHPPQHLGRAEKYLFQPVKTPLQVRQYRYWDPGIRCHIF
jgi:hypothetical protein